MCFCACTEIFSLLCFKNCFKYVSSSLAHYIATSFLLFYWKASPVGFIHYLSKNEGKKIFLKEGRDLKF